MTKGIRYSEKTLGWLRKPEPLRVWRIVEGKKKTADGETLRFSIQEIPDDRHEDVLDHMCTIFARDELLFNYFGIIKDPVAIADFRKLWRFPLQQGIVVGAFVVDENNPKPRLAGVNMTFVYCDETEKVLKTIQFDSDIAKKFLAFMSGFQRETNIRKLYNVEKYIKGSGLSVDPDFRRQGIAYHLLKARDEMAVTYDIRATSSVFTAVPGQKLGAKVDFELFNEKNYADVRNEDGTEMFPGISQKSCKFMGKKFSHGKTANGIH